MSLQPRPAANAAAASASGHTRVGSETITGSCPSAAIAARRQPIESTGPAMSARPPNSDSAPRSANHARRRSRRSRSPVNAQPTNNSTNNKPVAGIDFSIGDSNDPALCTASTSAGPTTHTSRRSNQPQARVSAPASANAAAIQPMPTCTPTSVNAAATLSDVATRTAARSRSQTVVPIKIAARPSPVTAANAVKNSGARIRTYTGSASSGCDPRACNPRPRNIPRRADCLRPPIGSADVRVGNAASYRR